MELSFPNWRGNLDRTNRKSNSDTKFDTNNTFYSFVD
jgi:hypothetical protein